MSKNTKILIGVGAVLAVLAAVLVVFMLGLFGGGESGVTGTIIYRERMALPDDAVARIAIVDTTSGQPLSNQIIPNPGQPPIAFEVPYDESQVNESLMYVVDATIEDSGGNPLFVTRQNFPVITLGNPTSQVEVLVEVPSAAPPAASVFITIETPQQGAILDISQPVQVSGQGGGLPEGNVVVQALDRDGNVLAEQATIIDAPDAGTGGQGPWAVALNINTEPGMAGRIRAFSPSPADNSVMAEAVVEVSLGRTAAVERFIEINEPAQGAVVDIANPVTVSGFGGGLPEGNVVVQAIDQSGNVLAEQATIVDAPDAGTGGQGPWSVQLNIQTEPGTAGILRAFSPSPADNSVIAEATVNVGFGQAEAPAPPTAQISGPTQGQTAETLSFDGSASSGQNAIVEYIWDFGDGNGATGPQVDQEYNEPGNYTVILTVIDDEGLQGSSNLAVQIYPVVEAPDLTDLENKDWSLVQAATFDTQPITALFQSGTVSGFSGCNTYTGSYQSDGSSLTISGITTTQLACEEEATTRENNYLANLGSVNGYVVQNEQLTLTGAQPMTFMEQ